MVRTLATHLRENPKFNIYLQEQGRVGADGTPKSYRLIMPDENGVISDEHGRRKTGLLIEWPTNPHNTGETAILDLLNGAYAHGIGAPVTCPGFGRDQSGRHFRAC